MKLRILSLLFLCGSVDSSLYSLNMAKLRPAFTKMQPCMAFLKNNRGKVGCALAGATFLGLLGWCEYQFKQTCDLDLFKSFEISKKHVNDAFVELGNAEGAQIGQQLGSFLFWMHYYDQEFTDLCEENRWFKYRTKFLPIQNKNMLELYNRFPQEIRQAVSKADFLDRRSASFQEKLKPHLHIVKEFFTQKAQQKV